MDRDQILVKKTYLTIIKNSLGSKMFRSAYFKKNNKIYDVTRGGALSCAFFVSAILYLMKLSTDIHMIVSGLEKDMKKSGWYPIQILKQGAVIIWEPNSKKKRSHSHIGFYWGHKVAISNSSKKKYPIKHNYTMGNQFHITKIYWHDTLN